MQSLLVGLFAVDITNIECQGCEAREREEYFVLGYVQSEWGQNMQQKWVYLKLRWITP